MISHIPRNDAVAQGHVCPGIRIHSIDIVQPPGMGISLIADIDVHRRTAAAVLTVKSRARTAKKARWGGSPRCCARTVECVLIIDTRTPAAIVYHHSYAKHRR
jgi:hypothetical protein